MPTITSRAGKLAITATPIFQSHPSGSNTGSIHTPVRPSALRRFHSPFSRSGKPAAVSGASDSVFSSSVASSFAFSSFSRSAFSFAADSAFSMRSGYDSPFASVCGKYSSAHTSTIAARMIVPARIVNARPASIMRRRIAVAFGRRYDGSSITNTGGAPRSSVRFSVSATSGATVKPIMYIANSTSPGSHAADPGFAMNAPMSRMYTGSRAEQLISGATRMVASRSRRFSMTRVAMIPGTAHATLDSMGMNDFPLRPHRLITRSMRNAARAMYPQSSRTAMNPNRIMICGRNTSTLPTPLMIPSTTSARSGPDGSAPCTAFATASCPPLMTSMSGFAHRKIDWNIRNMTTRKTTVPHNRCVRTLSMRSVQVTGRTAGFVTAAATAARTHANRVRASTPGTPSPAAASFSRADASIAFRRSPCRSTSHCSVYPPTSMSKRRTRIGGISSDSSFCNCSATASNAGGNAGPRGTAPPSAAARMAFVSSATPVPLFAWIGTTGTPSC